MSDDKPEKRIVPYRGTHHDGGYSSQEDWNDENLSRGDGDPDTHGYPGQDEPDYEKVNS